jgi:hypothetical protein
MSNKTDILKEYLFHLAFENQQQDDYITEKVWGALAAGTLPVYSGASNIKDHVPPHSIVVVDDFATVEDLARYLGRLANDRNLYQSYHTLRYQPLDSTFVDKFAFTHVHSTCRICRFAYATRHGLAWNHSSQEVVELFIPHTTCINKMGLVGHPFKEYWLIATTTTTNRSPTTNHTGLNDAMIVVPISSVSPAMKMSSNLTGKNRLIDIDGGDLRRRVWDRDGVTVRRT